LIYIRDIQPQAEGYAYARVEKLMEYQQLEKIQRLDGFQSITEGLVALAHDIRGLQALLGWREPTQALSSG
jgi:hypothetical protein